MRNKRETVRYRALVPLWHSVTGQDIAPGELVNLDHLEMDRIQMLIEGGSVDVVRAPEVISLDIPAQEASNGPEEI